MVTTLEDRSVPAAISGTVFYDINADDVQIPPEANVPYVAVSYMPTVGSLVTGSTNEEGYYEFPGLASGSYTLTFTAPIGYSFGSITYPGPNGPMTDTSGDGSVLISVGTVNVNIDVPLVMVGSPPVSPPPLTVPPIPPPPVSPPPLTVPPLPPLTMGLITGRVWNDIDRDGMQDLGEQGIAGVLVEALNSTGGVDASTSTAPDGTYTLTGVPLTDTTARYKLPIGSRYSFDSSTMLTTIMRPVSPGASTASTANVPTYAANVNPVAVDDIIPTIGDPVTCSTLANDTDADGDQLTATLSSPPTRGTVSFNTDGTFTYTPLDIGSDFMGQDEFTYSVSDGFGGTASATVTILSLLRDAEAADPVADPLASAACDELGWTAVEDADSYDVYRGDGDSGTLEYQATVYTPGYLDATAVAGQVYSYQIVTHTMAGGMNPPYVGPDTLPTADEIRKVKEVAFEVKGDWAALKTAVDAQLAALKTAYPDYTFKVKYGP